MFWKKKTPDAPLGVPLQDLELMLGPTTIKARRKGDNILLAKHDHYTVKVEVLPADERESVRIPF